MLNIFYAKHAPILFVAFFYLFVCINVEYQNLPTVMLDYTQKYNIQTKSSN